MDTTTGLQPKVDNTTGLQLKVDNTTGLQLKVDNATGLQLKVDNNTGLQLKVDNITGLQLKVDTTMGLTKNGFLLPLEFGVQSEEMVQSCLFLGADNAGDHPAVDEGRTRQTATSRDGVVEQFAVIVSIGAHVLRICVKTQKVGGR